MSNYIQDGDVCTNETQEKRVYVCARTENKNKKIEEKQFKRYACFATNRIKFSMQGVCLHV